MVTRAYENNTEETLRSKIPDGDEYWHRIGDIGYLDEQGRLWFCGRKAHRVTTVSSTMDTIPCEAIINTHPSVFRSALVGVDQGDGYQLPVIVIEPEKETAQQNEKILAEVRALAKQHDTTENVDFFLIHPSFPVDIRHNAKIFREKLKVWAEESLAGTV